LFPTRWSAADGALEEPRLEEHFDPSGFDGVWRMDRDASQVRDPNTGVWKPEAILEQVIEMRHDGDVMDYRLRIDHAEDLSLYVRYRCRYGDAGWAPYTVFHIEGDPDHPMLQPGDFRKVPASVGTITAFVKQIYVDPRTRYRITKHPDGRPQYSMLSRLSEDRNRLVATVHSVEDEGAVVKHFDRDTGPPPDWPARMDEGDVLLMDTDVDPSGFDGIWRMDRSDSKVRDPETRKWKPEPILNQIVEMRHDGDVMENRCRIDHAEDLSLYVGYACRYGDSEWAPYSVFHIHGDPDHPMLQPGDFRKVPASVGTVTAYVKQVYVDPRTFYRITKHPDGRPQYILLSRLSEDGERCVASVYAVEDDAAVVKQFSRDADPSFTWP
jgi:hypothetical protein